MYLANIKLWNFRKYWPSRSFDGEANLDLNFEPWLNVLIWANDSWKSAILDAIKLVLKPNTWEWIRIDIGEDFFKDNNRNENKLKIELTFTEFKDFEARHFAEFLIIEDNVEKLVLSCEISHNWEKVFHYDVKAWKNWELWILSAEQRELLNVTYLKPLRDVKTEFIPKKNSRLSTILQAHKAFQWKKDSHILMGIFKDFDESIKNYFEAIDKNKNEIEDKNGQKLKEEIDSYIQKFLEKNDEWNFWVSDGTLKNILERLELTIKGATNPWLGSLNRLFIASELLHLEKENDGLKLWLIEEIEAHIHPQAQMKVIETLQEKAKESGIQIILTTHSPNLASRVKLKNLIICTNDNAFPIWSKYTELEEKDYRFLERFIDVTKSNLFFSEWVMFVEWWAEEIILPSLAKILKRLRILKWDLIENQVSVVNIWHANFWRYKKIFERKDWKKMWKKIAIITDLDLKPKEYEKYIKLEWKETEEEKQEKFKKANIIWYIEDELENFKNEKELNLTNSTFDIQWFISTEWTLEYCLGLFPPFQKYLYHAILLAFKEQYTTESNFSKLNNFIENFEQNSEKKVKELWENDREVALKLYQMILWEEKIAELSKLKLSKTIVAQYFAEFIENDTSFQEQEEGFKNLSSISYLINAIKYACNEEE